MTTISAYVVPSSCITKHFTFLTVYAELLTINQAQPCWHSSCRDAQIEEKKHMLQEEEERALDLQMEIDRLKALEAYEERERQRTAESRIGAQILNEQIVERKRERVHQEELRDLVRMLAKLIASNFRPFMVIKTKD